MSRVAFVVLLLGLVAPNADALELGVIAGEPSALTLRAALDDAWGLELIGGASPSGRHAALLGLSLRRTIGAPLSLGAGAIVPAVGLGPSIGIEPARSSDEETRLRVALRLPFSLGYRGAGGLELYFELAPSLELAAAPRLHLQGGVGLRAPLW